VGGKPGLGSKLLDGRLKPNVQAINLSVSFILAVGLAMITGWLVVSINKIDSLEKSGERLRFELQAMRQLETRRTLEVEKILGDLQAGLSTMDKRISTIERRLNIGIKSLVVGPDTAGASGQSPPPTRRIILDNGSLVIKTPLVE